MKYDIELLKRAARAAGYEVNFKEPINNYYPHGYDDDGDVVAWWNPIMDDGDAFRLQVKMRFLVQVRAAVTIVTNEAGEQLSFRPHKPHDGDALVASRYAVVCAAAAQVRS